MKITGEMLGTAMYAMRKRMQGYTLLKNPKGTAPNEVNMIKGTFGILCTHADEVYTYKRLQRKKINGKTVITKRELFSTHYLDPKTKKITKNKEIYYVEKENGRFKNDGDKFDLSIDEENARPKPKLEKEYVRKRYLRENAKNFYQTRISWITKLLYPGIERIRHDSRPIEPGFFKTLIANLKNTK